MLKPQPLLLCCDLDRTLLPNGAQPESPLARVLLRRLAQASALTLVYVSGRHLALVEEAIAAYQLPEPDGVVADVGTSLYRSRNGHWAMDPAWGERIGVDWNGREPRELAAWLEDLCPLRLQEEAKQGRYKLSYYLDGNIDPKPLLAEVARRLALRDVHANLIWSVDETCDQGLLDIVPKHAGKGYAVAFLCEEAGLTLQQCLFAGDSGNDLAVIEAGIPFVLVANATDEVRKLAVRAHDLSADQGGLYLARGGYLAMNGNYSAGVLEGVAHYHDDWARWLCATAEELEET